LDVQDIQSVTFESLRPHIGVVPQDCVLFNDTLLHNLAYGKLGATQEQIDNVVR
jgi:ABC-type transport system involved in Fe-S cluster assembly fused permease/ATPase subunit